MAARFIGAHMPTGKGLDKALRKGVEIGCSAVQVFTSSPQQWKAKPVSSETAEAFAQAWKETGLGPVVSHDSYLVNLCAPNPEIRGKSFASLQAELERCALLGLLGAVSHIGAHMGQGEQEGLRLAAEGILQVLEAAPDGPMLLMETTAGQGSSLHHRFEDLATTLEHCQGHPRLGVCLDTCHVFAAGYDVRTAEGLNATLREFDRLVGLDRLKVVHCNDSKKDLGSRVDRHEHIGQGKIGRACFEALVNHPALANVPIVVETPEAEEKHAENVALLLNLRRTGDSPKT